MCQHLEDLHILVKYFPNDRCVEQSCIGTGSIQSARHTSAFYCKQHEKFSAMVSDFTLQLAFKKPLFVEFGHSCQIRISQLPKRSLVSV